MLYIISDLEKTNAFLEVPETKKFVPFYEGGRYPIYYLEEDVFLVFVAGYYFYSVYKGREIGSFWKTISSGPLKGYLPKAYRDIYALSFALDSLNRIKDATQNLISNKVEFNKFMQDVNGYSGGHFDDFDLDNALSLITTAPAKQFEDIQTEDYVLCHYSKNLADTKLLGFVQTCPRFVSLQINEKEILIHCHVP